MYSGSQFQGHKSLVMGKAGRSMRLGSHICGSVESTVRGAGLQNHRLPPYFLWHAFSKSPAPRSSAALPNSATNWGPSELVGDMSHSSQNKSQFLLLLKGSLDLHVFDLTGARENEDMADTHREKLGLDEGTFILVETCQQLRNLASLLYTIEWGSGLII